MQLDEGGVVEKKNHCMPNKKGRRKGRKKRVDRLSLEGSQLDGEERRGGALELHRGEREVTGRNVVPLPN